MKKLLALILCVMMFVAVMPTSAFAGGGIVAPTPVPTAPPTGGSYAHTWEGKMAATKAVEEMSDAITNMYSGIAADQGVFNTVKAIDDTIKSMADSMFDGIDEATFTYSYIDATGKYVTTSKPYSTNKDLTDAAKAYLREHVGDEITKYMNDHISSFTDSKTINVGTSTGSSTLTKTTVTVINPIKYMNTFATAASKAMSSEKAAKNIEAIVYAAAMAKVQKDTSDKMDDLYNDMQAWGDLDKLAQYGWSVPGNPSSTDWDPYVFINADDPYYNGGFNATWSGSTATNVSPTNVSLVLKDFAE
jgi:polyhydroxyalkanoate synthesis regulator protein